MNLNVFVIVVALLLISQIVMIVLHVDLIQTVKAGNKGDYHFRYSLSAMKTTCLNVGGRTMDVSSLMKCRVRGNSMRDYNVHDGQTIYVETLDKDHSLAIKQHPIVVFSLKNSAETRYLDSNLKLRKFIAYIQLSDRADALYEQYKDRIKLSSEEFSSEFDDRVSVLQGNRDEKNVKYILSSTFNEQTGKYHYSIHSTDSVRGIVKYVI